MVHFHTCFLRFHAGIVVYLDWFLKIVLSVKRGIQKCAKMENNMMKFRGRRGQTNDMDSNFPRLTLSPIYRNASFPTLGTGWTKVNFKKTPPLTLPCGRKSSRKSKNDIAARQVIQNLAEQLNSGTERTHFKKHTFQSTIQHFNIACTIHYPQKCVFLTRNTVLCIETAPVN